MTGAQLYTYILEVFKRTDKSTEVYEAITDVVMDMRLRFNSEDFKTTSANLSGCSSIGDYTLTLPTDFKRIIGDVMVRDSSSDQAYDTLAKISIQEYNVKYPDRFNTSTGNRNTGTPRHYCVFGGDILVGPPVDKTTYLFKISYSQEAATDITSATSDVPFSSHYRKTLRYGVLEQLYLMMENYEESTLWGNKYREDVGLIVLNDMNNVKDNAPAVYSGF